MRVNDLLFRSNNLKKKIMKRNKIVAPTIKIILQQYLKNKQNYLRDLINVFFLRNKTKTQIKQSMPILLSSHLNRENKTNDQFRFTQIYQLQFAFVFTAFNMCVAMHFRQTLSGRADIYIKFVSIYFDNFTTNVQAHAFQITMTEG